MSGSASVTVNWGSVRNAWRRAGYDDFWLQLRTRGGTLRDFSAAVFDAMEHPDIQYNVQGQFETASPKGFVVRVDRVLDEEHLRAWLDILAAGLARRGITGALGAPSVYFPRWLDHAPPEPTAVVAWPLDLDAMAADPDRQARWHVAGDATTRICDHIADWVRPGGPQILVRRDTFAMAISDGSSMGTFLASAVTDTGRPPPCASSTPTSEDESSRLCPAERRSSKSSADPTRGPAASTTSATPSPPWPTSPTWR